MSDLYLQPANGVADIAIDRAGNPELTGGLDNAVYLSLFVGPWWTNRIEDAGLEYRSTVPEATQNVLSVSTARNVVESAQSAVEWMIERNIAAEIDIDSNIATRDRLDLRLTVREPSGEQTEQQFALTWDAQQRATEGGRR